MLAVRLCLAALLGAASVANATTMRGFVTAIRSRSDFDVGSVHVTTDGRTQCFVAPAIYNITLKYSRAFEMWPLFKFSLRGEYAPTRPNEQVACKAVLFGVGSSVALTGYRTVDGPLRASSVVVYRITRYKMFGKRLSRKIVSGEAVIASYPEETRSAPPGSSKIWLDGYPLEITPHTERMGSVPNAEVIYDESSTAIQFTARPGGASRESSFPPASPKPNTYAIFRALRTSSGPLIATRMRLWPNRISEKERLYCKQIGVVVQPPDYKDNIPGEVLSAHDAPLATLSDARVQAWVARLGAKLIPEYQKRLPESDPTRIHFHFYVARGVAPAPANARLRIGELRRRAHPDCEDSALALPDGTIILLDSTLVRLRNTAQLAAILSGAITRVLQKQSYIVVRSQPGGPGNYAPYILAALEEEQEVRIGIHQMYLAGYDIREAPFAWSFASAQPVINPIQAVKGGEASPSWIAAYAFDFIDRYYPDVDYRPLKRGRAQYAAFLKELRQADPQAFAESKK